MPRILLINTLCASPPDFPALVAIFSASAPAPVVIPTTFESKPPALSVANDAVFAIGVTGSMARPIWLMVSVVFPATLGILAAKAEPPVNKTDASPAKPTGSVANVFFIFSKLPYLLTK